MALTTDIQKQIYDLLSRNSNISFVTADQETGSEIGLTPGQRVSAEVLSTLPNNLTQVQVGQERFNLQLPIPVRPGQTLEMTFVSGDPRSTFAIPRQGGSAPPVSLSDASRLLSLLVSNEQAVDPGFRSSLRNIGDMLRRSSGETGVLANLMDEALTYAVLRDGGKGTTPPADVSFRAAANQTGTQVQQGAPSLTPEQTRLTAFESSASQILKNVAQNSRFILMEAANQPVTPLPFLPGDEVAATVVGTLPGGRTFVQVAGSTLELQMSKTVQAGEIIRLTYISSLPKPVFAIPRSQPDASPASLSEAGRWLSVLEHSPGGVSGQQMNVLERLSSVLKSLPPNSPAFTAIRDEAITYQTVMRGRETSDRAAEAQVSLLTQQQAPTLGNGIVLNDDMAKLLQAVIRGNRLALLETLNQQAMPTGLVPGQMLKGEVLAAMGSGRFMVQVAGQMLEFNMPKGVRRGDMLNLFFITEEPSGTFLMARFGRLSDSRVSETGRWLSGFLATSSERMSAQAALNILSTILSAPPSDASQVSSMLQQGLRESGLFYESHLARWFGGDYALEDLLKEPQGRLSPRIQGQRGDEEKRAMAIIRSVTAEVMEAAFKQAGTGTLHERIVDQRTLPVVSEQLSTLQNGQLMLRGDLFPGQRLEWTVAEREARHNDSGERERTWETRLNIKLPRLGQIEVKLALDGTLVNMYLVADDDLAVPHLESGKSLLTGQFEAAGLKAAGIVIQHASS